MTDIKRTRMSPAMQSAVIRGLQRTIAECEAECAESIAAYTVADRRLEEAKANLALARKGVY